MRSRLCIAMTLSLLLIGSGLARAENSVTVESKQVEPGATNVTVGIYLENELPVSTMVVPLEIRAINPGSFIVERFEVFAAGRVAASGLTDMEVRRFCGYPAQSNTCSGPLSHTWDRVAHTEEIPSGFFTSPSGLLWAGLVVSRSDLPPGVDPPETPSLELRFDVTGIIL